MMEQYAVVTVLDNLSETSMPWNEFVLYRHKHNSQMKQYVIVCDTKKENFSIPENLDITFTGFDASAIRRTMKRIREECAQDKRKFVIHLHQNKSAAFFNFATLFTGYASKTVFTVHSQFPAYNLQNKVASLFNVIRAKRVTNVSATSYNVYPCIIKRIKKTRIGYIENGVDIDRIDEAIKNYTIYEHPVKRFVYVARMIPLKKHDFLIDVFSKVHGEYQLILIGAEDPTGKIRAQVNRLGMQDKVIMTGLIPRDELFSMLAQSDVYVSSSTIEGLPVSVLEAMSVGLPALISDIPPHIEIKKVCDEIITIPFDEAKWVKEIEKIINSNKQSLKDNGSKCRNAVINNFSLSSMHNRYYSEYEKLLIK